MTTETEVGVGTRRGRNLSSEFLREKRNRLLIQTYSNKARSGTPSPHHHLTSSVVFLNGQQRVEAQAEDRELD